MRPIIEQVDEFIECFFDGSVYSIMSMPIVQRNKEGISINKVKMDMIQDIVSNFIPNYIKAQNKKDKDKIAFKIFQSVTILRQFGDLRNNPDKLTELNHYKTENSKLREENEKLRKNVQDLTAKFMALSSVKDKKIGVV